MPYLCFICVLSILTVTQQHHVAIAEFYTCKDDMAYSIENITTNFIFEKPQTTNDRLMYKSIC